MGGPLCSTNPDNLLSCLWWDFLTNLYGEVETKNLPSVTFNKKRMCNPRRKLRFSNLPSLHREGGGFQVIFFILQDTCIVSNDQLSRRIPMNLQELQRNPNTIIGPPELLKFLPLFFHRHNLGDFLSAKGPQGLEFQGSIWSPARFFLNITNW